MKRLLLPLLAALALPTAVNTESYDAGVAKIQWFKMQKLLDNAELYLVICPYILLTKLLYNLYLLKRKEFIGFYDSVLTCKPKFGVFALYNHSVFNITNIA